MPYLPYPDDWPIFAPKDKIGDWLEMYTKVMELNYWNSTVCKKAEYDEASGEWTVHVEREGKPVVLKPKQLILATGMSAVANVPDFPGMDSFKGELHHSSKHPGGEQYSGKKPSLSVQIIPLTIYVPTFGKMEPISLCYNDRPPTLPNLRL